MPNIIKNAGRISPTPMGDYDTTTTYRRLDWVKYGGTSYICRKNNTVNIPPSDPERWQKIVDEITDMNVEFTEPTQRVAFVSGESLSIIIGKIKKFLSDLSTVAFSGKYSDLSGTPGTVSKTASGLVPQLPDETMTTKYLRQDGTWSIPPDTNTQAVASVNGKTGAVTLNATDVKAFPAAGKINKLTNIGQITSIGFWAISAIDNTYATSLGIDNVGDFHALVLSYNGNGTNSFNFGTIILSSPRLEAYHYVIQVWEGTAIAVKSLNNRNVLNTIEEISANTESGNVAGALAAKTIMADYNAKINTINSNMTGKAPLKNPALTGTPTAPTASTGTNTTQIATTAFVRNAFAHKTDCTINLSDVSARINNVVPYGKTCWVSMDATVANNITTGWHTIISGLPSVKENQHYQAFIFKPNNIIEIRDGLFTSNVFNIWLDASDAGSRIIANAMIHIS